MKKLVTLLIFTILCLNLTAQEKFDAVKMKGVKVSLLSEIDVVKSKEKFTVAIYIQHFEGFHTYWKNPGLVGFPTQVKWTLPLGFKAGEIQWQVPERSKMLKYNCHGYKGDTFLLVEIEAPQVLPDVIDLKVNVGGMSCSAKSCCSIGYANTSVKLKKGSNVVINKKNRELILAAKKRIPKTLKGFKSLIKMKDGFMTLEVNNDSITMGKGGVYFFPDQNIYDTESKQDIVIVPNGLQIKFKLNDYVPEDLKVVSGLLYSEKGWGNSNIKYLPIRSVIK
jgi:DsbC/DsbD-like thiol-disulfide interchange protein